MLINLSNHPSSEWSENQKQTAISLYHSIIDISFPQINPEGDEIYINNLADEFLQKILTIKNNNPHEALIVHLMGELTFCFALLKKLQQHNIPCVASTTKRIVEITPDNKKISKFEFVKFRHYL